VTQDSNSSTPEAATADEFDPAEPPLSPERTAELRQRLGELAAKISPDWMGYSDDLGDNAGRCEMFAGPKQNGYRTQTVWRVNEDCDCGCFPPTPHEMYFIELARLLVPGLLHDAAVAASSVDISDLLGSPVPVGGNPDEQ
jgi:hypothetical protein